MDAPGSDRGGRAHRLALLRASVEARKAKAKSAPDAEDGDGPGTAPLGVDAPAPDLGPLGGLTGPRAVQRTFLGQKPGVDASSMVLRPSQSMQGYNYRSRFEQPAAAGRLVPSDVIGGLGTPTARALTMRQVAAAAKQRTAQQGAEDGGARATAADPSADVIEVTRRQQLEVAQRTAGARTAALARPPRQLEPVPGSPDEEAGPAFYRGSALDKRRNLRNARKPATAAAAATTNDTLEPTPAAASPTMLPGLASLGGAQQADSFDPDAWAPTPVDDGAAAGRRNRIAAADDAEPSASERAAQQTTVRNYGRETAEIVQRGARTAAGTTLPLAAVPQAVLDSIRQRLQIPAGAAEGDSGAQSELLRRMEEVVEAEWHTANATSTVRYQLRDAVECARMQIDPRYLDATAQWWVSDEYTSQEWRSLRKTGVPQANVVMAHSIMEKNLCNTEMALLGLQQLWITGTPPAETALGAAGQTYAAVLFTDVETNTFRAGLPLTVKSFSDHVRSYAMTVREVFTEYWVTGAAECLSHHLRKLRAAGKHADDADTEAEGASKVFELDAEEWDDQENTNFRVRTRMSDGGDENQAQPDSEGLAQAQASGPAHDARAARLAVGGDAPRSRVQRTLDAASMLMSRQLRDSCESSIESLALFFERFGHPHASGDSAFAITLAFVAADGSKAKGGVLAEDDAMAQLAFEPSISECHEAFARAVDVLVQATQHVSRADSLISPSLDDANTGHIAPCPMQASDESVLKMKRRIAACVDERIKQPAVLKTKFAPFLALLCGQEKLSVNKVMEDVDEAANTRGAVSLIRAEVDRLRAIETAIGEATVDLCTFSMFSVDCRPLKQALCDEVQALIGILVQRIVGENHEQMEKINADFDTVAATLTTEPVSSAELQALQEYSAKSSEIIHGLQEQLFFDVNPRNVFLFAETVARKEKQHVMSREQLRTLHITSGWPERIKEKQQISWDLQNARKREFERVVEDQQERLEHEFESVSKKIERLREQGSLTMHDSIITRIQGISKQLLEVEEACEDIAEQEKTLEMELTDNTTRLGELKAELAPLEKMWSAAHEYLTNARHWNEDPLPDIDAEEADMKADGYRRTMMKMSKEFEKASSGMDEPLRACTQLLEELEDFMRDNIPLMFLLCTRGLRERHWEDMEKITCVEIGWHPEANMEQMLEVGLHHHTDAIEETCVSATKEYSLEKAMDKMEEEWEGMDFNMIDHKSGTAVLGGTDDIQQILDDQIVKAQAMAGSRYIKPYIKRIQHWEKMLTSLQDIIDECLKVQATWMYLEPIFSSEDIMRQMPKEGELFRKVDALWRDNMAQTQAAPAVLTVAEREGIVDDMKNANEMLDVIQKGLNDYLETKRLFFARFFFLSNDELLEILSETKDPLRVQPHCKKCFDGIQSLDFADNLDIKGMVSPEKENVPFAYEATHFAQVNPMNTGGNVEVWLLQTQQIMLRTVAQRVDEAMADYPTLPRLEFAVKWPGQVVLAVNQIEWVKKVEKTLPEEAVGEYAETLQKELLETVELVRGKLSKLQRKTLSAMVVMDVHNRDTTGELAKGKVQRKTDFDWLAQLRYYWKDDNKSAQTGEPGTVECYMINAMQYYAFEYLGNSGRLVITPLTDRCYRTLMGALHLNLGGAPEGPAGTGKTETTKDLGKAIAIQCVVFNCSDGLDYLAMGKFFKGLASSGAWACFDEFNRIQLEVLSVVAQQVLCIQLAKAQDLKEFLFEGTTLPLKKTCCPFITMNPGYAGRAELPDNLKVLFRTVAMMVPDYAMIAEILLYSFGYTSGKEMATKIVMTYKLCSEQLSSQSHYDYGMRAVIAVLLASGNLKRNEGHLPEDVLVLRSIIEVNLPKFLAPDVPLFQGITSDLFPGVKIEDPDRENFLNAVNNACAHFRLQTVEPFVSKVIQTYEMMVVRHSFMIVGLPFAGKTMCWRVLQHALTHLHADFPDDDRWRTTHVAVQNPKSITMGQLYGQFDPVSHEWSDGVLAINYRNCATCKTKGGRGYPMPANVEQEDRKWMIFDGPVDAIWIENMNTVMDDNKKLCLMSGEIMQMSETMSMMMEPMDLAVASPATVSRNGVIYMEPQFVIGWRPLLASWLDLLSCDDENDPEHEDKTEAELVTHPFNITPKKRATIEFLFEWLVEPCIAFVRREITEMSPTVDANLVQSMINIMESMLEEIYVDADGHVQAELKKGTGGRAKKKKKEISNHDEVIECCFLTSLIWSVGASSDRVGRQKFSDFLRAIMASMDALESDYPGVKRTLDVRKWEKPEMPGGKETFEWSLEMPKGGIIHDYAYSSSDTKWKKWEDTLVRHDIPDGAKFQEIVVPTVYTGQFDYLLDLLLTHDKKILVCGPTGTGKSCYAMSVLSSKLPPNYENILVTFSAKTTANMTQDIIDGKLDRRRKGVFGPGPGKKAVVFVDDLNMPEIEEWGAQPPIELLRNFCDKNSTSGGWYDLKEMTWKTIVDCGLLAAMGPPGGGRNALTPRFLRHFNLVCFTDFDDATLKRIFNTILTWHFTSNKFDDKVAKVSTGIVDATLHTYRAAMENLLPTPLKSHYTFNLRDFSRVAAGVMNVKPHEAFDADAAVRLWTHECLRVFGDRLVDDHDRNWFLEHCKGMSIKFFGKKFEAVFAHLQPAEGEIGLNDVRKLVWGDYMKADLVPENRPYEEVIDMEELGTVMDNYLVEFNAMSRKQMNLVMFLFAIEHVSRVARVLKMPGGNALLVGVGGSGRQSVSRLAAFICDFEVKQIEISKQYGKLEWRDDLKALLSAAGTGQREILFLFSDTQIKEESFVEDINNMLNSGDVPNLFPYDERVSITEATRPHARAVFGKAAGDMSIPDLWSFFITRVRARLHVVLAFSPIGDAFRARLRLFPSLINCCTIDWFTSWPEDALVAVARKFLGDLEMPSDEVRQSVTDTCQFFHLGVQKLNTDFKNQERRINYVTPTSYLELIQAFRTSLGAQREIVTAARNRYLKGLEQLAFAEGNVETMKKELIALQPTLKQAQKDTDALMAQIEAKLPGVQKKQEEVGADAAVAQEEADRVSAEKASVEADLAEAIPALEEAIKALNTLKPADINEVKNLKKPPGGVRLVCEAVCVMKSVKPVKVPDPEDPSKKIWDYWGPSQTMLAQSDFLESLRSYDKDNIDTKIIKTIRDKYQTNPDFTPEKAAKASKACAGLCKWVCAMDTYDRVAKVVAPKRAALKAAESKLEVTMGQLNAKKAELKEVEDNLQELQDKFDGAVKKKDDLAFQVDLCAKKLDRAKSLIEGLGGEKVRWTQFAEELGERYERLLGDVLISAGVIAYLGAFTSKWRDVALSEWVAQCQGKEIPCSERPSLNATLGDPVKIRQWNIEALPTDGFSVDNGIVIFNSRRWPLCIDPQQQANKWIRNMEADHKLEVIKLTEENYLRTVENAVQFGFPVLLENIMQDLDPSIEPLLLKQTFKTGGVICIRLGDSTIEYSENFRFYMTTKLRNPHYLPEVVVKVTLLNFMITPEGLEDQLLGIVVQEERPDLQEAKAKLIVEGAENKRKLKECEDNILHILAQDGNILEDEGAIVALKESSAISDDIKEKQIVADKTEADIDTVRNGYQPVAYKTQVLFFCIAELCNIEPVYQYSLTWFINLFISSIRNSKKTNDVPQRLANIDEHYKLSLYRNICRSLLEKDKLLFSFLLTVDILSSEGHVDHDEWYFLLTGGVAVGENPHPNPTEWLSAKGWAEACRLSDLAAFSGLREAFSQHEKTWHAMYDAADPHVFPFPGEWNDRLNSFQKMMALRCVRPDKVVLAVQDFVLEKMGENFVKPPPFNLKDCFADSSVISPLVFILSPGSDPMGALVKLAGEMKIKFDFISLGQGQGPVAEAMISKAREAGSWVVLQNCHLAPSWMNRMESIAEDLSPDNTHDKFRMWCTSYPSDVFPVSILQNGVKMTQEPPRGMRANLLGSFGADPISDPDFYDGCTKGADFHALTFCLCFFHALVQERRQFGPLGWNIPYEFNESDLRISVQQLKMFLEENDETPIKALRYTVGECNYGGRVTDDKDRRTLHCILNRCYRMENLKAGSALSDSGTYTVPPAGTYEEVLSFCDAMPLISPPEVFGMHENANITKNQNETTSLFTNILVTQSNTGGGGGEGGTSKEDTMDLVAADILDKLMDEFDMEQVLIRYPVKWAESMNTVLSNELTRFNRLIKKVKSSLVSVRKAIKGLVVMSAELEALGNSLFFGRIPVMWKGSSYPSLKPLSGYCADLYARLEFFDNWLQNVPPSVFWMSGFFFTQAFLTGASQNFARKYTVPIDQVDFDFEIMPRSEYTNKPKDGVYTYGLFLEGAKWDKKKKVLAEADPKVLFVTAPIIWFKPMDRADLDVFDCYNCPVYKTSDRRGILSTTGHSTNFVCFIKVPSDREQDHWVLRGALLVLSALLSHVQAARLRGGGAAAPTAMLVFNASVIHTMGGPNHDGTADAFCVSEGRFAAVGTLAAARAACGAAPQELDMKGAAVIPGLIDSHAHLMFMGFKLARPQLDNCTSANGTAADLLPGAGAGAGATLEDLSVDAVQPEIAEATEAALQEAARERSERAGAGESVVQLLQAYVRDHPLAEGAWLQGFGWDQNKWHNGAVGAGASASAGAAADGKFPTRQQL
eukprot:g693.t1